MTKRRRPYLLPAALLAATAPLAVGCSDGGGPGASSDAIEEVEASGTATLDGVPFDVRRDPG